MSRPSISRSAPTAPGVRAPRPPGGPAWIAGVRVDLLFFIGVPALLVPLIVLRQGRPAVGELILYLGAFGALGHHLPGMMRAYGDRDLFHAYRARLVLAPLFLIAVCVGFSLAGLTGVILLTFFWTTWHTLMQIFGFARIYEARGAAAQAGGARAWAPKWGGRLDHLLCIGWIGAPIAYSDSRVGALLELYYRCGGPLLEAGWLDAARKVWIAATLTITLLFLVDLVAARRAGVRPNPLKLGFLAVSFGFWWFCMAAVDHLVVGVALFDVFHDVQYLALVWLFQRRRVDSGTGVGGFTRFLFRRSGALIGLYVGLVVAYGSIGWFSEGLASETARRVVLGVLAASALFHFYLDGFIWKVRERTTRASLGLAGGAEQRVPGWALHGAKWALFVVPLSVAAWAEARASRPESEWRMAIAEAAPGSAEALASLAADRLERGDLARAVELARRAVALKPTHAEAHHNLGAALRQVDDPEAAVASYATALQLRPDYALAHLQLANLLAALGRADEAEGHYRDAIRHGERLAEPRANLAALLVRGGDAAGAVPLLREALELEPEHVGALNNLAWILATSAASGLRDPAGALTLAERLDRVTEQRVPQALHTLAAALAANGRFEEAVRAADRALELAPPQLAPRIAEDRARFASGAAVGG